MRIVTAIVLGLGLTGCFQTTQAAPGQEFRLRDAGSVRSGLPTDSGSRATTDAATRADAGASVPPAAADGGSDACPASGCQKPATECSDRSRDTMLSGAIRDNGLCPGACRFALTLPARASGCDSAVLSVCDVSGSACTRQNSGVLTPVAHEQARSLATPFVGVSLASSYGCPGCADEPTMTLQVLRNRSASTHRYNVGGAPAELHDADAFMQDILDALDKCVTTKNVVVDATCKPP